MKKYIHVTKEVRQELAEVFKVGDRAVWNALSFDKICCLLFASIILFYMN